MKKTAIRYFFDFKDKQEKWLNEMAASGFRLVHCGRITYTFELCSPDEYQYYIELVGGKSDYKNKDYKIFLEGLGYTVLCKNINLNWSVGKIRYRPWADGVGKISSSQESFNRELFIVEKKNDGKHFELHTDTEDAAVYFKTLRNTYFSATMLCLVVASLFIVSMFTTLDFVHGILPEWLGGAVFLFISALAGIHAIKYMSIAKRYKEIGKTNE